ncbi:hypothetical protein FOZ61_004576 [Perkinsus olseni]|uniref:Uncharacterized protein n=1 Tax=Perkinsus olseni TaxID=32597 RepID=A0A7J6MD31_PEROL|nr:hypothetical protein FOZ61_004576 [Perkinsus olseni]KAF4674693.1 hypothetical protein FOL46_004222 [Perkinsus olseni]
MGGGEAKEPSASAVTPERVVSETALITASATYKKAPSWTMTRRPPHQDPSALQRSPGPAAYTLQSTMMEGCATGGFGSKTGDRFMTTPWQHRNPGPTDYTPKLPEETRVFNPSSKLFSLPTAGRQAGTHKAGMDSPGPAYYLHRHKNIGTDTRKAGFGFAVGPGLGHHEMSVKPRPGPDQYIIKSIFERNIEAKKGAGIGYGPRGQGTFGGLDNPGPGPGGYAQTRGKPGPRWSMGRKADYEKHTGFWKGLEPSPQDFSFTQFQKKRRR